MKERKALLAAEEGSQRQPAAVRRGLGAKRRQQLLPAKLHELLQSSVVQEFRPFLAEALAFASSSPSLSSSVSSVPVPRRS